ncbi:MAG: GMC oxidoreductase [Flavobacteriia bacterium]|jgi:choline dehydrogenase-like flavoprotein
MGNEINRYIGAPHSASNTYDAIVIGSGITGGWAAKELCEGGLKTLLLERGRNVEHIKDYPTAMKDPWEFEFRMLKTTTDEYNPIQSHCYDEGNKHFFVSDKEHPYIQDTPFNWIRGYQVGGRSLTWGRQVYRMSDLDFEANRKENIGIDWPIRYDDLAYWYSYVEKFIGVSGKSEGLAHFPDGEFLPPMEMNAIELHFKQKVESHFKQRLVSIGRVANLTKGYKQRGPCQYRNLCSRGCPYGGYFSSNSSTLPAAFATGNLTLRPHSIAYEMIIDKQTGKAIGVSIIDELTKTTTDYFSKVIFINASTIATTSLLLHSKSNIHPAGLGNSSGQLGLNLMDHHKSVGATGEHEYFKDYYYSGRRPTGIYIPRFRNLYKKDSDFLRGYGFQADGERMEWQDVMKIEQSIGPEFKEKLTTPGPWTMWMGAWGECLPYEDNKIYLDNNLKDQWGLPLIHIQFEFKENEQKMRIDAQKSAIEMLDIAGFKNIKGFDYAPPGGTTVHEMGTARMGNNSKNSVLNKYNQLHDSKNVFITDGSCMTSGGNQNPSLTYMALTARACAYAINKLKTGNL